MEEKNFIQPRYCGIYSVGTVQFESLVALALQGFQAFLQLSGVYAADGQNVDLCYQIPGYFPSVAV